MSILHLLVLLVLDQTPARAAAAPMAPVGVMARAGSTAAVEDNPDGTHAHVFPGIRIEAPPQELRQLEKWLQEIRAVPYGRQTLEAIAASGNHVTIRHSAWALGSSGRTLAPVTANLTNGKGENVEILFDARMPEAGSHLVFDSHHQPIPFTAVESLFHELAHARHLTRGDWRYFDSEGQAIEDENVFRTHLARMQGKKEVSLRSGIAGRQVWWPDGQMAASAW